MICAHCNLSIHSKFYLDLFDRNGNKIQFGSERCYTLYKVYGQKKEKKKEPPKWFECLYWSKTEIV